MTTAPCMKIDTSPDFPMPLITHFKTDRRCYIYEPGTNEILWVSLEFWKASQSHLFWQSEPHPRSKKLSSHKPGISSVLSDLHKAREDGMFKKKRPRGLSLFMDPKNYIQKTDQQLNQLILCITEQCNFRCSYCLYTNPHPHQRQHCSKSMPLDTAQKAVDFFLAHNQKAKDRFISFYGGEPTLNFSVVKEVVRHAKQAGGETVSFNMTTNGYNLSHETLKFLVDNQFVLLISMDGPAKQHDRYRRTIQGRTTHWGVVKTLERLRKIDPDYCNTHVRLSIVVAPPYDMKGLKDYFDNEPLFSGIGLGVSGVTPSATDFFSNPRVKDALAQKLAPGTDHISMFKEYQQNLINSTPYKSRFLTALFEMGFLRLKKRMHHTGYSDDIYANGLCKPGIRRLYVTIDGKFKICEKVNDTLEIGTLKKGINSDQVFKLLDTYLETQKDQCIHCFANRLCPVCFASDFSSEGFNQKNREEDCCQIRQGLIENLTAYCHILEHNPQAFDFMETINLG